MAADINRVNLTARLTREPELRRTQSGMSVLNIGVAFNDRRKNAQTGDYEDVGNFADCVVWGKRAESLANFLHKGSRVAIEGKLRWSSWERDGQKRSKLEVMVDELVLLDPKPQGGGYQQQGGGYNPNGYGTPQNTPQQQQGGYQQPQQGYQQQAPQQPQPQADTSIYDDDIPF